MKTYTLALLTFFILPVLASAQPTINNNEFYHIGDVIKMVNVDMTTVHADSGGANRVWDYSTIQPIGASAFSTTTVLQDTVAEFSNSNLMEILPDGRYAHVQENSSYTYINAIVDPISNTTTNYYYYKVETRPISYNSTFIDTFHRVTVTPNVHGKGYVILTGDGYGTLHLPSGTYNNVLRVKRYESEIDTTTSTIGTSFRISYMWFDNAHNPPLFRIDSSISQLGITAAASYLSEPTSVANVQSGHGNYNCSIQNNELTVTGRLDRGQVYEVVMYSILGSKVFAQDFKATDLSQRFETGRVLTPGIYMVSIALKNDAGSREVMKVVKQ